MMEEEELTDRACQRVAQGVAEEILGRPLTPKWKRLTIVFLLVFIWLAALLLLWIS